MVSKVSTILKAVKYRNLDEARSMLMESLGRPPEVDIFDDDGDEPQGLLSVVPEDRLKDEDFYTLFESKKGTLIEVEKISYKGFGPPADEQDYMGFISEQVAYVTRGCRFPIEISDCCYGARDFHHLDAMVLDGSHPLNADDLAERLELSQGWTFDTLFDRISDGSLTADEIDDLIHKGIQ
jgi:hypothetical protein